MWVTLASNPLLKTTFHLQTLSLLSNHFAPSDEVWLHLFIDMKRSGSENNLVGKGQNLSQEFWPATVKIKFLVARVRLCLPSPTHQGQGSIFIPLEFVHNLLPQQICIDMKRAGRASQLFDWFSWKQRIYNLILSMHYGKKCTRDWESETARRLIHQLTSAPI